MAYAAPIQFTQNPMSPGYGGEMMNGYSAQSPRGYGMGGMMGMDGGGHMGWRGQGGCHQNYWNQTSGATILIQNYWFHPPTLWVEKGTTVTWTNLDNVIHEVRSGTPDSPTDLFDSGEVEYGESFSFTFSEAGTYNYFCEPHPDMIGLVVVR